MPDQSTNTSDDLDGMEGLDEGLGKLAQSNLGFFRELHKSEQPLASETLWVHVVHGTWANPENSKVRPTWSEPGGSLEKAIRSYAAPDLFQKVRFANVPPWSGRNSFGARNQAVQDLNKYFNDVLFDPGKTFARHLVIAHSHGGTVAAEALRNLGPLASEFAGFVTLGTPFVQRVQSFEPPNEITFDSLTGLFAPAVALFFSLSLAIAFGLEKFFWLAGLWLVYAFVPASLCQIRKLSSFGWALCSITPLIALVLFWLALGGKDLESLLASSLVAAVVSLYLGPKLSSGAVRFLNASDSADSEEQMPRPIEVPLLAIRAPGDEASLAIAAASGAIFLSDTIRGVGSKLYTRIPERWGALLSWAIPLGLTLTMISAIFWQDSWPAVKYVRLAGSIAFLAPYAAISFVLIVILAFKFSAVILMAIACGWEAFEAPGIMKVYAEPLPRSRESLKRPMTLRMTFPTAADLDAMKKKSSLRHSIYEYPSVQEYLASWILSFIPQ